MAKCKRSSRRPQPNHKTRTKSQHDKRKRLERRNAKRKKTTKAKVPLTGVLQTAVSQLQACMDRRIAFRLAIVIAGMLLADDRRTASAWFVAGGVCLGLACVLVLVISAAVWILANRLVPRQATR